MKCAYKQVLAKMDEERLDKQESKAVGYALALALKTAKEQFGYDRDELISLLNGMYSIASESFEYYADDKAERYDVETVPFIEYGLKRRIEASDCDVTAIEKQYMFVDSDLSMVYSDSRYNRRQIRDAENRLAILLNRELSLKPYWYSFLTYMAEDLEIAGEELTKFYTAIREEYRKVWLNYLYMRPAMDMRLSQAVNSLLKEMSDFGVDIDTRTNKEREQDKANEENEETDSNENNESEEK